MNKKIKVLILLNIILIILFGINTTYSRYKSARSISYEGTVLKWHFDITESGGKTQDIELELTRTDSNTQIPSNMIAPGTYGQIPIHVDTTGTQTNMKYEIILDVENCPENLKFYSGNSFTSGYMLNTTRTGTGSSLDPQVASILIEKTVDSQSHGVFDETIYWNWSYETGQTSQIDDNDISDMINYTVDDYVSASITINAEQILEIDDSNDAIYALYDSSNQTLFMSPNDYTDEVKANNAYYGNIINNNYSEVNLPAWSSVSSSIRTVDIVDEIKPKNTCGWFIYLSKLTNINHLDKMNTSRVVSMECMFAKCSSLTSVDLSNFDTTNVLSMDAMFYGCSSLTSIDLSSFNTTKCQDMGAMFYECINLTSLNVQYLDLSNVIDAGYMFKECSSLTTLDVSNFNTQNVEDFSGIFSSLTVSTLDVTNWDTSSAIKMKEMFWECSNITSLNLSGFDTSNVENMSCMFLKCYNLSNLNVNFNDTSQVKDMSYMFYSCTSLSSLNVSSFDTSNVENMYYMFIQCTNLTSLDLKNFNTSKCNNMEAMFAYCSSLQTLDIRGFDTSKVKKMKTMFFGDTSLVTIYSYDFNTSSASTFQKDQMFEYCISLVGGNGTTYSSSNTNYEYARIDTTSNPGYFTTPPSI